MWDITSGRVTRTFGTIGTRSVTFSPDGRTALSGGEGRLRLWDVASGREVRTFGDSGPGGVYSVAISPDGRIALSGGKSKTLMLWDVASGSEIQTLTGHSSAITSVAFSPDGLIFASGSNDNTIKLWNIGINSEVKTLYGHSSAVTSLAFSPDGNSIISGSTDKTVKLWDATSGREIGTFSGHSAYVFSVAFSPDGQTVLSGGADAVLKLWDVTSMREILTFGSHMDDIYSVTFSPDGRSALFGGGKALKLWNVASGRRLRAFGDHETGISSIAISPDGRSILSGGGRTLRLEDALSGREIRTFGGQEVHYSSVAFSPDGRSALSGGNKEMKLWDVTNGREIRTFNGHTDTITSVAFSPDGQLAISGSKDRTLKLWDIASGRNIRTFFVGSPYIFSAAFSPDGQTVISGADWDLKLYNLKSGREIRTFSGHSTIESVVFSPDGKTVLSGSRDGKIKLWNVADAREIRTFDGHGGAVHSVSVSPDGRLVLSGSAERTLKFWDIAAGSVLVTMYPFSGDEFIAMTPEGFFDATPDASKALSIVRGLEVYSIDQVYDQLYRPDLVREKLTGDLNGLVKAAATKINLDAAIGSGGPPKVSFVNSPTSVGSDNVRLEVDVADQGGGIGKVEWRVGGVTVGVGNRGVGRVDGASTPPAIPAAGDAPTTSMRQVREIALAPGENTIEVIAYNARGLVASVPATLKITSSQAQPKGPGKLWVLGIGVNDYYDSRLALNYAVPDAQAIVGGFKMAKGTIYDTVETRIVADGDVTVEKLDATFSEIGSKVKPQDTFVLFVAGHGKTVDGRYYFLPRDFRYRDETSFQTSGIGQPLFQEWLSRVKAQRSVLLFDTCESGSLTEDREALRGVERAVAMEKMTAAMGRTTIAAASDDKPALEGYRGHGVFTYAILQGFSAADMNHDGKVDVLELIQYLDRAVPDLSDKAFKFRQIPQAKFSGNNFTLANQTTVVADEVPASAPSEARPIKPTHVVIAPAEIMVGAGTGVTSQKLAPGALVNIVRTDQGWVLVAKDGREIGFVSEKALARLQ